MQYILLIDGENFKGKLESIFLNEQRPKPCWHEYDFRGLIEKVLAGLTIDRKIVYIAKLKEHPQTLEKSRQLIEEQRLLKTHLERQGFEVVMSGRVRGQMDGSTLVFKEKGVDVQIAVDITRWSCDKQVKGIVLVSSDSDLQPAITEVKRHQIPIIYLGFESRPNKGLMYTTNRTILIRNSEVIECAMVKKQS